MGPQSYMRSVVDRNVVLRRIPVIRDLYVPVLYLGPFVKHKYFLFKFSYPGTNSDFETQSVFSKKEEQMTSEHRKQYPVSNGYISFVK